jgi:hypothetical protein
MVEIRKEIKAALYIVGCLLSGILLGILPVVISGIGGLSFLEKTILCLVSFIVMALSIGYFVIRLSITIDRWDKQ